MRHSFAEEWERTLEDVLQEVDHKLEERFGKLYRRHPVRPAHGQTVNRRYDGLFRLTANFTAGFGSATGPGYVVDIGISTLDSVAHEDRKTVETTAVSLIRKSLPQAFPQRDLRLIRDGTVWKVVGDLSLRT